jgi:putative hydrolase of HD superfamily
MKSAKVVIDFYTMCVRLKDVVRSGWKIWDVQRERLESVAEHIWGVQVLAIAMWSQYGYSVDIYKVIMMLAVHELEEVVIGDLTQWDISSDDKTTKGHSAIHSLLKDLLQGDQIEELVLEFDARETAEAKFAYHCDKLECDIQSTLYDREGCVDLMKQDGNMAFQDEMVQELLHSGCSWSSMWCEFGRRKYGYDQNFMAVSNYAVNCSVTK